MADRRIWNGGFSGGAAVMANDKAFEVRTQNRDLRKANLAPEGGLLTVAPRRTNSLPLAGSVIES
jgi:hypothetical protein